MLTVHPDDGILGARIEGIDLGPPLPPDAFAAVVHAVAAYGVVCFPHQHLDAAALKAFSGRFGTLEASVAGRFQEPGIPEVMLLSNIVEDGQPIGLGDAGQDWA